MAKKRKNKAIAANEAVTDARPKEGIGKTEAVKNQRPKKKKARTKAATDSTANKTTGKTKSANGTTPYKAKGKTKAATDSTANKTAGKTKVGAISRCSLGVHKNKDSSCSCLVGQVTLKKWRADKIRRDSKYKYEETFGRIRANGLSRYKAANQAEWQSSQTKKQETQNYALKAKAVRNKGEQNLIKFEVKRYNLVTAREKATDEKRKATDVKRKEEKEAEIEAAKEVFARELRYRGTSTSVAEIIQIQREELKTSRRLQQQRIEAAKKLKKQQMEDAQRVKKEQVEKMQKVAREIFLSALKCPNKKLEELEEKAARKKMEHENQVKRARTRGEMKRQQEDFAKDIDRKEISKQTMLTMVKQSELKAAKAELKREQKAASKAKKAASRLGVQKREISKQILTAKQLELQAHFGVLARLQVDVILYDGNGTQMLRPAFPGPTGSS